MEERTAGGGPAVGESPPGATNHPAVADAFVVGWLSLLGVCAAFAQETGRAGFLGVPLDLVRVDAVATFYAAANVAMFALACVAVSLSLMLLLRRLDTRWAIWITPIGVMTIGTLALGFASALAGLTNSAVTDVGVGLIVATGLCAGASMNGAVANALAANISLSGSAGKRAIVQAELLVTVTRSSPTRWRLNALVVLLTAVAAGTVGHAMGAFTEAMRVSRWVVIGNDSVVVLRVYGDRAVVAPWSGSEGSDAVSRVRLVRPVDALEGTWRKLNIGLIPRHRVD